jgi:hypothetical protein
MDWRDMGDGVWQCGGRCNGRMWQAVAHTDYTQADWRVTIEGIGNRKSDNGPFNTVSEARRDFERWAAEELPEVVR